MFRQTQDAMEHVPSEFDIDIDDVELDEIRNECPGPSSTLQSDQTACSLASCNNISNKYKCYPGFDYPIKCAGTSL